MDYPFLFGCDGLTSLDLTPLAHFTRGGDGFLHNCRGLTKLDLTPLAHLTSVGDGFLLGCAALDLMPLAHFTRVGDSSEAAPVAYSGRGTSLAWAPGSSSAAPDARRWT